MVVKTITIRDSLYFTFNGIKSKTVDMLNVNVDGGMQEEHFASSQSINKEKIKGRNKPYFQGVERDVLKLSVEFAFEEGWTDDELRKIRRWLTEPTYYVPLIFSNNPEKIYYVLYVDEPKLLHNSLSQGYITLNFECNDSYAYSPLTLSPVYEWDQSSFSETITDFSGGEMKSIIINSEGYLILDPHRPKWSDFASGTKWSDLQS